MDTESGITLFLFIVAIAAFIIISVHNYNKENKIQEEKPKEPRLQEQHSLEEENKVFIKTLELEKEKNEALSKENKKLKIEIQELKEAFQKEVKETTTESKDFRKRFPAELRCKSGIYVRSKSERDIIDFFFDNRIKCEYERSYKSPINNQSFSADFYLPDHNLYIEYFGMDDEKYNEKKDLKIRTYKLDKNINFEYLTYEDDNLIYDKLREICGKNKIRVK